MTEGNNLFAFVVYILAQFIFIVNAILYNEIDKMYTTLTFLTPIYPILSKTVQCNYFSLAKYKLSERIFLRSLPNLFKQFICPFQTEVLLPYGYG